MENKTAEKAKKGALSIVFSRTALILLLVVVQFLLMLGIATYLRDYVVYVYSAMNILGAVIVIYIINQRGNPAFNMTWVLLILIFPVFGCLFYLYVKSQLGTRSVSYTHLDVYKRQRQGWSGGAGSLKKYMGWKWQFKGGSRVEERIFKKGNRTNFTAGC